VIKSEFIEDVFAGVGKITVRRMFGGQGIYAGDVMFALGHDDTLYVKTDDDMQEELAALGSTPFIFQMANKPQPTTTGYWRLPESALDDPEEATAWAKRALAVAKAAWKPVLRKPRAR
jgi:DNA transformation protein